MRLSPAEWEVALEVCTRKQLEALDYWNHGFGYKRIGVVIGVPRDTAKGRVDRAREAVKFGSRRPGDGATIAGSEAA